MLRTPPLCRRFALPPVSAQPLRSISLLQRRWKSDVVPNSPPATTTVGPVIYTAPLLRPFRRLKIFSLTSLALSITLSPFIFLMPAPLPTGARIALAASAVGASGFSTLLIAWASRSYVNIIRREGEKGMRLESADWLLRRITTTVWDTSVIRASGRPFASWELPDELYPEEGKTVHEGETAVLAKTEDWKGRLQGQWIVEYKKDAAGKLVGKCRGQGRIIRHFNVSDELVDSTAGSG
ncbi:hypothetical protein CALCODRAFT_480446 [Calocera cornea HHB12733]|uniref:Uncharacterized protein n=1 Tax=Calocera cornea HHB12733 TaxID=1353952 RepID=A0A165IMZ4_9BASI|nr:hypothetical protein CALCODRAFT_480446 [Calocera cornea HHB12733]